MERPLDDVWQRALPKTIAWGTVLLFAGLVLGYVVTLFAVSQGALPYWFATPICAYLAFACFTVLHDAGHGSIVPKGSKLKPLETILGWICAVPLLLVPYRAFQKIHDRHHAFTNDPDRDPDHFFFGDRWYQVILNCLFIPVQYHKLIFTRYRKMEVFRATYLSTFIYMSVVLVFIGFLFAAGYWKELLFLLLIPNVLAVFVLAMFFDYLPHHPSKSLGRFQNTRIFPSKLLNIALLGQNYHLIHHMYPRLPWYSYQPVFKELSPVLDAKNAPIEDALMKTGLPSFLESERTQLVNLGDEPFHMLLYVKRVEKIAEDAVHICFDLPYGQALACKAGQYVTVSRWMHGNQMTRCYSICDHSVPGEFSVGVRDTHGGGLSSYINTELKAGDELIVQGPFGDFVLSETMTSFSANFFIAAGSGITPIINMIRVLLRQDADASMVLCYQNATIDRAMFRQELLELERKHNNFTVNWYFSQSTQPSEHSKLNANILLDVFRHKNADKNTQVYVCGSDGIFEYASKAAGQLSIPSSNLHYEQFVQTTRPAQGKVFKVEYVHASGLKTALNVAENQTVLEIALAQDIEIPDACGVGTCGTCRVKVKSGIASVIESAAAVSLDEQKAGYTLACQCRPTSDLVLEQEV